MAKFTDNLSRVRIAAPCSADWEGMTGTERVRFCNSCNLHVYNLSAMTRAEAEHLVTNTEDRLCVRFYRRADGTILTQNCPVGLRRLKQRARVVATATLSAVIGFITGFGSHSGYSFGAELKRLYSQPEPQSIEPIEDKASGAYVTGDLAMVEPEPTMGAMVVRPVSDIDNGIYANGQMTLEPIKKR